MRTDKILFIDTETGGLDPSVNSLLSIAFAVWEDFKVISAKEVLINDGILNTTPEALKINHIDIEQHSRNASSPVDALKQIQTFISKHFEPSEKITLGGHNINFDVNFFKSFAAKYNFPYDKVFSHRIVDTATILYYLYLAGKIKQKTISSTEAFALFGISVSERHTAIGDAIATAELFSVLLKLISKNTKLKRNKYNELPNLFD